MEGYINNIGILMIRKVYNMGLAYQCVVISTPKWAEINNIGETDEKVSTLESWHTDLRRQWPPGQVELDTRPMVIEVAYRPASGLVEHHTEGAWLDYWTG